MEILRAFDEHKARFFLLNWHRRAHKTTLILNLLIRECIKNPKKIYGYIAPTYTQAKAIIWRDPNMLERYLPADFVKRRNESELYVEFNNGSVLAIKGADNPDSIRGQDFEGVGLDEWALIKPMVWEEILRPIITQSDKRWAMFAFTPKGRNHAYDYWVKAQKLDDWYISLLTASVSKLLPEAELAKTKAEMPPTLYDQEFECSFIADEDNVLIPTADVDRLLGIKRFPGEMRKVISCDPSQGGDECVIMAFENTEAVETKIMHIKDTMLIAGEIAVMMNRYETNLCAIDSIGIGAGICDRLRELGKDVEYINSAETAGEEHRFANRRAEMWWYAMEQIRKGNVAYPKDAELRRELSSVHCRVVSSNGKIQLEPKDKTKELLGRSPDRADAFVYGLWALQRATPDTETSDYGNKVAGNREIRSRTVSAMAA
ncbi:MAG: terminase family protein [Candidatus Omnitrophota bacterium]